MRFDGHKYVDCRWCGGRGCLQCENEFNKDYERAFPNGPQPIATFDLTTPEGAEKARAALGVEALTTAFGPNGGGMKQFMENLEKVGR